jgi:SAM-dependent methyltransferase
MSNNFAGLSAPEYDSWRQAAEFHRLERTIIERMLMLVNDAPRHILDLGCGTGTWTRTVARLYPAARILGVDLSKDMLAYACQHSAPRINYVVGDGCKLPVIGEFDLVICALSADYIGFRCVSRAVASVLSAAGVAVLWVLDPSTYEMRDGRRIKKWIVGGHTVCESAAVFDPVNVCDYFVFDGLHVVTHIEEVNLSDGKPRRLFVYVLRRYSDNASAEPQR